MATLGDIILNFRAEAPDPCQVLGPPPALTGTLVSGSQTGTLTWQVTWTNAWGESLPSAMQTATLASNALKVSGTMPAGATGGRIYYQLGQGQPVYESFTSLPYTLGFTTQTPAVPPGASSAWLPDTDGSDISAYQTYRWLNMGMDELSRIWQGVLTLTGVATSNGQGIYQLPGQWIRVTDMWYDAWPLMAAKRETMFLYNPVPGIAGYYSQEEVQYNSRIQIWPQAQRNSMTTTVASQVGATDSVVNVATVGNYNASGGGFLSMGLAQLGPVSGQTGYEIISYIQLGASSLLNVFRGLNFTTPQAWPVNTPVTELNLRTSGRMIPPRFTVGQASVPTYLQLPPSWSYLLSKYMLAQYRRREQADREAQQLLQEFRQEALEDQNSSDVVVPRQMGEVYGLETMPGGFLGGVIVP